MTWAQENIDSAALAALGRVHKERSAELIAMPYCCLDCGNEFNGSALTPHLCPSCGSAAVMRQGTAA